MLLWILIAGAIFAVAVGIIVAVSVRPRRTSLDQSPFPPGARRIVPHSAVGLEKLKCQECGAELEPDDVTAGAGPAFVSCSYCGSTYQLVEESG